ncbi:putative RNA-binding protein with PIN domain [Haloferula luteola]|uniref:Putative RNA-binding protein with PIN domain n=1 Tax=Haloferula luteola TaxID=595692 RepID=A0A840V2K5_9BACT|nr:NYN domain-containing protein [Haloferula luteola]MBB5352222.1 putative RNA-binding protein with PIN domain [Haloferula luteola]
MERLLVVDGHSAIFAMDELRSLHQGPTRHLARLELTRRLRDLGDRSGWAVVVVFDGRRSERNFEGGREEGIMVVYSKGTETADAVVERIAARFAMKGDEVRVASNDRMVLTTALAFGATGIRIPDLERWMEEERR